jgi:WD40 repeat protein
VTISANGQYVAALGSPTGPLFRWHVETGKETRYEPPEAVGGTAALALAYDGRHALVAVPIEPNVKEGRQTPPRCTIHLVDLESGQMLARTEQPIAYVQGLAMSPDRRYAVSVGHDKNVIVWDLSRWTTAARTD